MLNICRPLITAHAGCENSPENTIESVQTGIDAGADIIEIDVRTSSDGLPVLIHDPYIDDREGRRIIIAENPYEAVQAAARTRRAELTPFVEVLEMVREKRCMLNIDLKDIAGIRELKRLIAEFSLIDHVIFSGCGFEWAEEVTGEYPRLQVLLNAYRDPVLLDEPAYQKYVWTLCRTAASIGCCGINIDYTMCRSSLVEYAKKRFIPVSVWTVDEEKDMRETLLMGVFAVTTNYPRKLLELMCR